MSNRIVNKVRIKKMYSEPEIFEPIYFHEGVNLILGDRSDESTTLGRKTNGVGKSVSIDFLNYCLLKEFLDSRISKIPDSVLPKATEIKLDIKFNQEKVTIIRTKGNPETPIIIKNGIKTKFDSLKNAALFMKDLLYTYNEVETLPSFRAITSMMMRDERSEFKNILNPFNAKSRIPDLYKVNLFFFEISLDVLNSIDEVNKSLDDQTTIIRNLKKDLTNNGDKPIKNIKSEINALKDETEKINLTLEMMETNMSHQNLESELLALEEKMSELRKNRMALKTTLNNIQSLPEPEKIDSEEISILYNQFKKGLGDIVKKSLAQANEFKKTVETFQNSLVNQRAVEIKKQLSEISKNITKLDDEYSKKMRLIDKNNAFSSLKTSLNIYYEKNAELLSLSEKFDSYEEHLKEKEENFVLRSQRILKLGKSVEESKIIIDDFNNTIADAHEIIMGNKECSFSINTINKKTSKKVIEFDLRIFDDGSHSVDREKVFIYDTSLMFNKFTSLRHPMFLVHDNIFDVDQDTLVNNLNFLSKKMEMDSDFQYILTLNRDKILLEESMSQIDLDVDSCEVATFTKENKFLKKNYQEL